MFNSVKRCSSIKIHLLHEMKNSISIYHNENKTKTGKASFFCNTKSTYSCFKDNSNLYSPQTDSRFPLLKQHFFQILHPSGRHSLCDKCRLMCLLHESGCTTHLQPSFSHNMAQLLPSKTQLSKGKRQRQTCPSCQPCFFYFNPHNACQFFPFHEASVLRKLHTFIILHFDVN